MTHKVFFDTNIIIDLLDYDRPNKIEAIELFKLLEDSAIEGYISETVITSTDYILRKSFSQNQREIIFKDLLNIFTILTCTNNTVQHALNVCPTNFEDAILYQIAAQHKLDYFVTNDKQATKKLQTAAVQVVDSKALVKMLT